MHLSLWNDRLKHNLELTGLLLMLLSLLHHGGISLFVFQLASHHSLRLYEIWLSSDILDRVALIDCLRWLTWHVWLFGWVSNQTNQSWLQEMHFHPGLLHNCHHELLVSAFSQFWVLYYLLDYLNFLLGKTVRHTLLASECNIIFRRLVLTDCHIFIR